MKIRSSLNLKCRGGFQAAPASLQREVTAAGTEQRAKPSLVASWLEVTWQSWHLAGSEARSLGLALAKVYGTRAKAGLAHAKAAALCGICSLALSGMLRKVCALSAMPGLLRGAWSLVTEF